MQSFSVFSVVVAVVTSCLGVEATNYHVFHERLKRTATDDAYRNLVVLKEEGQFCKPHYHAHQECSKEPKPSCTPYRSPDYCPLDTSYAYLVHRRTEKARNQLEAVLGDGHVFPLLEDKIQAYMFTTKILKVKAPKILFCGNDHTDALLGPAEERWDDSNVKGGFVIRATRLHGGQGVYAFPDGFGGKELFTGQILDRETLNNYMNVYGPQKVIIEEYVQGDKGAGALPTEYKVHVINGEIVAIDIVYNRGNGDNCACWAVVDEEWNRLDRFGCFTPSGVTQNDPNNNGRCYDIDFQTGFKKNLQIKGLDFCETVEKPECVDDLFAIAKLAGSKIGAYVRVDAFMDNAGNVVVQEYSTNPLAGQRHCVAKIDDETGCINSCFLGEKWAASGDGVYGGLAPDKEVAEAFKTLLAKEEGDADQSLCSAALAEIPEITYVSKCFPRTPAPTTPAPINFAPPTGETVAPSMSPSTPTETSSPSAVPVKTNKPSVEFVPDVPKCTKAIASWWGDPHFITFDNLKYDCQGEGEFIVLKAKKSAEEEIEIQGRFVLFDRRPVTQTKGVAVRHPGLPLVQVNFATTASESTTKFKGEMCGIDLYVDKIRRDVTSGSGKNSDIEIAVNGDKSVDILFKPSGFRVTITITYNSYWGCSMNTFVCVPDAFTADVKGLLGSPDGDSNNDWMTRTGDLVAIPQTQRGRRMEPAYDFCVTNWCVRGEDESLFAYEPGQSFSFFDKCNKEAGESIDASTAGDDIKEICGDDDACLIDGIVGGKEGAKNALEVKEQFDEANPCEPNFLNCDNDAGNGCETNANTSSENCGACGIKCNAAESCVNGRCIIDNGDGFCNNPFTLNGEINNNTPDLEFPKYLGPETGCILRLTDDKSIVRATSAFLPMTMKNSDFAFSMSIGYRVYGKSAGTADGMVFVMHQDPRGVKALGNAGGDLGVYGSKKIKPALVIEWDTHPNGGGELNDNGEDNIHIQMIKSGGSVEELFESSSVPIRTSEDGTPGTMWVDYDGKFLRVSHDRDGNVKPSTPLAQLEIDLANFFTGSNVTVGYTASTWGAGDYHDITSWSFTQDYVGELSSSP